MEQDSYERGVTHEQIHQVSHKSIPQGRGQITLVSSHDGVDIKFEIFNRVGCSIVWGKSSGTQKSMVEMFSGWENNS